VNPVLSGGSGVAGTTDTSPIVFPGDEKFRRSPRLKSETFSDSFEANYNLEIDKIFKKIYPYIFA
jgi:hypothetical protein